MNRIESNNPKVDRYEVLVEPFHVDFNQRIFVGTLCNHMLNAAGLHSENRGWGITELMKERHTWVLSRLSVEFERMPVTGETIILSTWVQSSMRLFTHRCFALHDTQGNAIGYAHSVWAMINVDTRKPADLLTFRDGELLKYAVSEEEEPCPIADFQRMRFREPQLVRQQPTYYSDVDINRHINSIKYIEHIANLLTNEQHTRGIRRLDIAYKTESYQGDVLDMLTEQESDNSTLVEVRKPNGEVAVQVRITLQNS